MTPEQVNRVAFRKPTFGARGYCEADVDDLLDRIEEHFRSPATSGLTAADVEHAVFSRPPMGHRGYRESDVDLFLAKVVQDWV